MPDRVVIDTNNIISIFLQPNFGFFSELKDYYKVDLFTCNQQLTELTRALNYEKVRKYLSTEVDWYIQYFRKKSITVEIDLRFERVQDPKDNFLVDLAYAVKSHYLVSGDKQVLNLKQVNQIKIISMADFIKLLKEIPN